MATSARGTPTTPPSSTAPPDGGLSWTRSQPLADPPGSVTQPGGSALRPSRVRAFGATLLVEATGQAGGRQRSYVFKSGDGGATWRYLVTAPDEPAFITFVTDSRWLRFVFPAQETTDAGVSWHAFTTTYQQAAPIAPDVTFADAAVGYATVRGTITRTADGGVLWTGLRTPGT